MTTPINPYADAARLLAGQQALNKCPQPTSVHIERHVDFFLGIARKAGLSLSPPARILDIGCGLGDSVAALLRRGYEAYGIDVLELWGADFDQYWAVGERPPLEIQQHLFKVDVTSYRIPFPASSFDFSFTDQVLEHVFDYDTLFREICRVLTPSGLSVHRFPGPCAVLEGHINVPCIPLCRSRAWLTLWAWLGQRSARQQGMAWREVVAANVEAMRYNNYPTKARLRQFARQAGLKVEFYDAEDLTFSQGRVARVYGGLRRLGCTRILGPLLYPLLPRIMVLRGEGSALEIRTLPPLRTNFSPVSDRLSTRKKIDLSGGSRLGWISLVGSIFFIFLLYQMVLNPENFVRDLCGAGNGKGKVGARGI